MSKNVLTPMTIPITKSSGSRFRNSVEGLNQEVEIIIKETGEKEEQLMVSADRFSLWSHIPVIGS